MPTLHRAETIFDTTQTKQLRVFERGGLLIDNDGFIIDCGEALQLKKLYPKATVIDHGANSIITPSFVDCHVHAPQFEMMASAGFSLLEWLENHTFPTEAKYKNKNYAIPRWDDFCHGLLKCGTTSAAIYATSHTMATQKLFEAAADWGLRAHVGKVLMDQNAPENLLQPAGEALEDLEKLILKWQKHEFVRPAITVRFAPTSTPELLKGSGNLSQKYPHLILQTHLGETKDEIQWVAELFPNYASYTDVYLRNHLIHSRSLLGHCIYLDDAEQKLLREGQSHLIHCPSSNFFLGSGLFPYAKYIGKDLNVALGSDVGAGWDLSMQNTARCCYEAQALQKTFLKPSELLFLMTRAGALALGYEDVGCFEKNFRADFVVHNTKGRSLVFERIQRCTSAEEALSALLFLGGESTVLETYVQGQRRYKKSAPK